jgi:cellulose synthase/poly-beta-1,6-N-acetylglucosamine synthase-like glycosyltransferase
MVRQGTCNITFMRSNHSYLVDILNRKQKTQLHILICLWIGAVAIFSLWWFQPSHVANPWGFAFNSFVLGWAILMPAYYFYFLRRIKKPNPELPIPPDWLVAMVVTRAPSEPFSLVKKMLVAMKAQDVPHDTWLADEDPSVEILDWCKVHDVSVSTRKGVAEYNRLTWPRRTKCKEGNLAYFYDHYGYDNYDFVVQMDIDHTPSKGYLKAMLQPFWNAEVGYVTAPSICDSNARESWVARGRLFLESTLHGTLQAGYNGGWVPMCIGSHYAVRTKALKAIGGLGPELAEDHSTTLLMNAGGWIGQHSIDAEAHGEGPATFADAMVQEFQWARSLAMIFLNLTPQHIHRLTWKLKFQFLFAQLWYFFFSLAMLSAYLLPPLALVLGKSFAHVSYLEFLLYSIWPSIISLVMVHWLKHQGLLRPVNAKVLSWEGICFQLARWPWVVCAIIDAFRATIRKSPMTWTITPKAGNGNAPIPMRLFIPYLVIIFCSGLAGFACAPTPATLGYHWFALLNALSYLVLLIVVLYLNTREARQASAESLLSAMSTRVALGGLLSSFGLPTVRTLHRFSLNITKYAASNSSESPERHATRGSDFAANDESLFERSLENHLLCVRSILGRMKRKLPSRIEANVSKPWPLIGLTTSRCLLKERTFFLEKLQHALG